MSKSLILCICLPLKSLSCHDFSLEKSALASKQWKPRVSLHVLTRLHYMSIKRDPVERGAGKRKGHDASPQPPSKNRKPCSRSHYTCHWRKEKSFHIVTSGIVPRLQNVLFGPAKAIWELRPKEMKKLFDNFRWNNFPNLACYKTRRRETNSCSTNMLLKNREALELRTLT